LLLDEGEYLQADALYQQLAMSAGNAMGGRLGRVEALIGLQRFDAAQVQLDAVPDAQRSVPGYREVAAKLALARGDAGNALSQLRPLVEEQADRAALQALYGDALQAAQQLEAAASAYSAALAQDSDLPEALLGSAELQLVPSKVKAALELLHRADTALRGRIRPPGLRARRLYLLGRAYDVRNKRGDAEAAREALLEAVKLPGVPNDAYFFLAEALGGKGHAEARAAYQRYLELEPRGRYRDRARRAL
jgi:predicted Zn-dependent protease